MVGWTEAVEEPQGLLPELQSPPLEAGVLGLSGPSSLLVHCSAHVSTFQNQERRPDCLGTFSDAESHAANAVCLPPRGSSYRLSSLNLAWTWPAQIRQTLGDSS